MEPNTNHNIYILHGQQGQVRVVSTSARTPSPIIFPAQVVSQPIFFPNSQHQRVQLRPTFTRDNFIQMNSSIPSTETTSVLCNNCGVPSNNCRICDSCKKKICTNPKIVKSNQEPERSNKTGISSSSFYSRNSRENDFASFLKKTSNLSLGKRTNPSKKRTCTGKLRNAGNDAECITISSSDEETSSSNTSTVQLSSPDPCEVPSKQAKHDKEEDCIEAARSSSSAPAPSDPQNSLPAFQLDVKGIRIGQMKLQSSSVEITNDKIMCLAHCHNSHKTIILSINWSWVMTCDLCNDPAVPCIYLTINPSFLDHLREMLGMNGDKPNYNPDGKADEKEFMVFIDTDQVTESKLADLSERMKQIEKETGRNFIKLITKEQSESRQIVAAMMLSEDSTDTSKTVTISQIQTKRMLTRNHTQQPAAANEATSSLHIDEDVPAFFSGVRRNLFVYPPPPATGGITVTNEDVFCLNEGEFLNDVIIDFYFKYITNVMISSVDSQRTHIMSSFFYKRLIQKSQKTDKDISLAKHRHNQVKKWTRNVDLFEKDFIFIPVNESSHWFLVVICFPSLVKTENKDFPKPLQHYGRDSDICGSSENEQNSSNVKKPHGSAGERRQFSAQCNHTTSRTLVLHSKVINKTDEDSDITSSPHASPEQRSSQSYFADVESSQDSIDQEDAGDSMIGTSINLFSSTSDEQPQKSSQKEPGKLFDVQCNYTTSKTLVSHKTINKTDEDPGVSSPHAPPEHCNVKTDGDEVLEMKIDKDQMLLATKENHELYKEEDPDSAFPGSNSQNFFQDDMIIIQDSTHLEAADAFQESSIAHSFSCNSGESSSQITEPNLQTSSQDDPPDSQTSQDSIDQEDAQNFSQEDSTHKPTSEDPNDQDDNATSLVDKDKTSGDSQEEFLSCNQSAASSSADKDSQNFPQEESNDEEVQKIIDQQETQDDVIEICVSPNNLTEFTLPSDLKDTWLISPHKKLRVSVSRMASQICDSRQKLETPNNTPEPLSSASNKDASFILISSGEEGEKRRNKKDEDPGTNSPGNGMKESLANEKIFKKPCILVFDSLKGHSRSRIACNLREYLSMEWKTRKAKQHGEREFNKDTIKMCTVPTPQQDNYSDCGIFLLHYVEKFFSNPIKNFTIPIKDLANWFDPAECKTKRNELKNLILGLEKKLKNEKD